MKTNFSIYINYCIVLLTTLFFTAACSNNDNEADTGEVSIKMLNPTTVESGEELIIVGTNLDKVTSIVFPENITATNFTIVGNSQISVEVPFGFSTGNVTLKTETGEIISRVVLKLADPTIKYCTPSDTVRLGDVLSIKGKDLSAVKKITFSGNPGIVIEAIDFQRKSAEEIKIRVPNDTKQGEATIILETLSGKKLITPSIIIVGSSLVEPIGPNSILLFDFEEGSYPGAIWGAGALIKEGNNTYYRGNGTIDDGSFAWFFATDNLILDPIAISSKVLKFDIKTENPIEPGDYKIQWVMGNQWGWCTSGFFPLKDEETIFSTSGKWMTLKLEFSTIGVGAIGQNGTFGLACQHSIFNWSNICIDNVRIDPK